MQQDLFDWSQAVSESDKTNDNVPAHAPAAVSDVVPHIIEGDEADVAAPKTLGEARERYADAVSDHRYRQQYRTAFNLVARVLGRPVNEVPAAPQQLKPLLDAALPATVGISVKRWSDILSLARRGLRDLGAEVVMARYDTPLSARWAALECSIEDMGTRVGMSGLLRYLSRKGIEPQDFTEKSFSAYRACLQQGALSGDPDAICRQTARLWNRMLVANPDWPQVLLAVSPNPRRFSLEWSAFPSSLTGEIDRCLAENTTSSPFVRGRRRKLRPATLESRRSMFKIIASALVLSGRKTLSEVTSLAVIFDPDNLVAALEWMRTRAGGLAAYHAGYLVLARTIARHWLKNEAVALEFTEMLDNVRDELEDYGEAGLKPKNRERLRQFDDPANLDALYSLPLRVLQQVQKRGRSPTNKDAVRLMYACQVAILTAMPVRVKNLTALEIGKSWIDYGQGRRRQVRIYLPRGETKNANEYQAPLPERFYPLFDAWRERYRPLITTVETNLLFPSPAGQGRSKIALAVKLKAFIERETGLVINPHLFRHLAAKVYLAHDPNGIETVRQLLGHTSTRTTTKAYAEFQTDAAFRRHETAMAAEEAPAKGGRGSKQKRRRGADVGPEGVVP